MKPLRLPCGAGVAVAIGIAVQPGCGGAIRGGGPPGTLDDAGVFRLPDGAIAFSPGSGCQNYDVNAALRDYCWLDGQRQAAGPPCGEGVWTCHVPDENARCLPGPEGDQYCSAYFQQFVLGGGRAIATGCVKNWDPEDPPEPDPGGCGCLADGREQGCAQSHFGYICRAASFRQRCGNESGYGYVPPAVCVERNGVQRFERFCTPP